jgi:hypothetical protein
MSEPLTVDFMLESLRAAVPSMMHGKPHTREYSNGFVLSAEASLGGRKPVRAVMYCRAEDRLVFGAFLERIASVGYTISDHDPDADHTVMAIIALPGA